MKKILLASTALVGFAGAAAAEVSLSGYAEVGVAGGDAVETQFHNDVVINFNFSGSTDTGLEFGGKVQLDDTNGLNNINGTPTFDDEAFWVSGAFGKVTLGETDGAFDWALTEVATLTTLTDDHSTHAGYSGNSGLDATYDNQIARYEYSFGDFAVAVSAEMDDTGAGDPVWGIGGKWSGDLGGVDVHAGLGFQSTDDSAGANIVGDADVVGISLGATMSNGLGGTLNYSNLDSSTLGDIDHVGVGVNYTMGALGLHANWGQFDNGVTDVDGWGVAANYDLGGGAVVMAGYGKSNNGGLQGNGAGDHSFSLGLGLSF